MKRIVVLLTVVALMVAMLAMIVAPAFAAWDVEGGQCRTGATLVPVDPRLPGVVEKDSNGDLKVCSTL